MKTFTLSPQLVLLLEQMSREMAVPVEALVNQAVFNWARLHGYLSPGQLEAQPDEPVTGRVPVVVDEADAESAWKIAPGGSFSSPSAPVAPVSDQTAPSVHNRRKIVLVLAEREVVIEGERFLVGRDVSCDLTIDSARISRQHAVIRVGNEFIELEDLGSSNGTWFGGKRIERHHLRDGDEVLFGDTAVRVEFRSQ